MKPTKELIRKIWPNGVPPEDYDKQITLILELEASDPPAVSGRARKPRAAPTPPTPDALSKTEQARELLKAGKYTSADITRLTGTANPFMLLRRVGAVVVGKDSEGNQLYAIPPAK